MLTQSSTDRAFRQARSYGESGRHQFGGPEPSRRRVQYPLQVRSHQATCPRVHVREDEFGHIITFDVGRNEYRALKLIWLR